MPGIATNVANAFMLGQPMVLTRASKEQKNRNRDAATGRLASAGYDNGVQMSWDEYPFASSLEGGAGTIIARVPLSEQNMQGWTLSQFYRLNNVNLGDRYKVAILP